MTRKSKGLQSGSVMIEFAISMSILIPLFFGMLLAGVTAGRGIQAMQFTRDLGHMYGLGVDFSQTLAHNIVDSTGVIVEVIPAGAVNLSVFLT